MQFLDHCGFPPGSALHVIYYILAFSIFLLLAGVLKACFYMSIVRKKKLMAVLHVLCDIYIISLHYIQLYMMFP